jgi:hypothetical protein
MSGTPDAARYETLVERLLDIERRVAAGEISPLISSYEAVDAVVDFLRVDVRVVKGEATRSLGRLRLALHDRSQGAKPRLFFEAPERKDVAGAPDLTSAAILRPFVILAFLTLREGGISDDEAARWLAAELKRSGINQPNGKEISARTIIRWHRERGGKSLKGSDELFGQLVYAAQRTLEGAGYQSETMLKGGNAKDAARIWIKLLRTAGF